MESDFIDWLRRRLPAHPNLRVGIGDDAAILNLSRTDGCVVTTDTLTDQVDFQLDKCDPCRAGRKALAVNLSDLAAMAAKPVAVTVSLVLPRSGGRELAKSFFLGMLSLAEEYDIAIAGGDTNSWDAPAAITITAIGEVAEKGPWLRSGGKVGDKILVTGSFGGSILAKHFDFSPRVNEALRLNESYCVHAAIDVSDGLSLDLSRLAHESNCGAEIGLDRIPISRDAHRIASDGKSPLEHALADGEDFELILAVPRDEAKRMLDDQPLPVPLTEIGSLIDRRGLWQQTDGQNQEPIIPIGWEHTLD